MRLINFVRLTIQILITIAFIVLFILLYNGGNLDFIGVEERTRPVTAILLLCILFPVNALLTKGESFKKAITENALLLLICLVLILYLGNYSTLAASDTVPARYLPMSILREGDFDLDEFRNLHSRAELSGIIKKGNHFVSFYPVGAAIFAIPVYLPTAIGPVPANSWLTSELEKLSASLIVLLSAIVLYFTILRLSSRSTAFMITAIYALATSSFSVSSQALWQHGASQLCIAAVLYCFVRGVNEPRWIVLAGFPAAFAVLCRPTDALLMLPAGLYVLFHKTRLFPGFVLAGAPPILFQLFYNKFYFDHFFRTQWDISRESFWGTPLMEGVSNILFSPARGLLIYSPVLIFALIGMVLCWKKSGNLFFRYLSIGVLANLILYSKYFMWWGGYTYGPRLLADLSPILCCFLVFIIPLIQKRLFKIAFIVLAIVSFMAHGIGVYANDPFWNADMDVDSNPENNWLWHDNQLINGPKRAFHQIRIRVLNSPTTKTHPELFGANLNSDLPEVIEIKPSKEFSFFVNTQNTGKAVWNYGALNQEGNVGLVLNWYKRDRLLERFSVRRRLRYYVFPGDAYPFFARVRVPDREGDFTLEVSIVLSQRDSAIVAAVQRVPVYVSR